MIEDAWAASIEEPPCRNAFQSGFVLFAFLLFYFSLVIGSRQFEVDVDFKFGIRMGGYPFVWHQIKVLLSHFLQSAFLRSSSLCRIFNIVVSAGPATETPSRPPGKTPGVFGKSVKNPPKVEKISVYSRRSIHHRVVIMCLSRHTDNFWPLVFGRSHNARIGKTRMSPK